MNFAQQHEMFPDLMKKTTIPTMSKQDRLKRYSMMSTSKSDLEVQQNSSESKSDSSFKASGKEEILISPNQAKLQFELSPSQKAAVTLKCVVVGDKGTDHLALCLISIGSGKSSVILRCLTSQPQSVPKGMCCCIMAC
jgi:hypothetical protein